ncbi:hypothetical protein [Nocardia brasiliensis]|uniref:hypothetical protein n=1 Tax=Nocardia brasiliensis TaxID=37326 RepID=UPI0024586B31|nr:hypothetical protein [Nocardia brasiliensis]
MLDNVAEAQRSRTQHALGAARAWLIGVDDALDDGVGSVAEAGAQEHVPEPAPMELLCADPVRWRALDNLAASTAPVATWAVVLDSLLVLAIRRYDLEALATLLRGCAELGLTARPLPLRATGFLLAQQQSDGGFGFASRDAGRSESAVRIALTRHCARALQRICESQDSRMRKNPASRSPSPAMPSSVPS